MITRGTTPYHSFILPFKAEDINNLYVTYFQNNNLVLEKTLSEAEELINIDDLYENASMNEVCGAIRFPTQPEEEEGSVCQVTFHLTQEDTLKFKFFPAAEKNIAVIQIRVLTNDNEAYASEPLRERVFGVLKEGVI